jgi:hypothetical protein
MGSTINKATFVGLSFASSKRLHYESVIGHSREMHA